MSGQKKEAQTVEQSVALVDANSQSRRQKMMEMMLAMQGQQQQQLKLTAKMTLTTMENKNVMLLMNSTRMAKLMMKTSTKDAVKIPIRSVLAERGDGSAGGTTALACQQVGKCLRPMHQILQTTKNEQTQT